MSIKAAILDKNQGNEVDKNEYTNLIMDDMPINTISDEDKTFLEGFLECQFLSLNSTQLKNISNLPKMPKLERLELCDNGIETGLDVIATQYPELKVLKVSGNKINSLDELKHLTSCEHLESLDIVNNPVMGDEGDEAKQKIRDALPKLEVLNGYNKAGEEVLSDEEDEEDYEEDEDGEDDEDDDAAEDELEGDGEVDGEDDAYGDEAEDDEPAGKRQKTDDQDDAKTTDTTKVA